MENKEYLNRLVKDLFILGPNSSWCPPCEPENLSWFQENSPGVNHSYQSPSLVVKRLKELVDRGADLTNLASRIANVNVHEALAFALEARANPNMPGRSGMLPIERAISRGRGKIAELLMNHPDFDFMAHSDHSDNILQLALSKEKYQAAQIIFTKNPEFILVKDKDGSSVMLYLADSLRNKKINAKAMFFIKSCLSYASDNNVQFDINECNKFNQSIKTLSSDLARLITEQNIIDLKNKLENNLDINKIETINRKKLKI